MQNAWCVQYELEGRTVVKVFEGDSPKASGAVGFKKELESAGTKAEIYSRRRGFPPPQKYADPPRPGMLWCPYCIKWRDFEQLVVVRPEYETPELLRCTTCLISIKDYWVRLTNPSMVSRLEIESEMRKSRVPEKVRLRKRRR